MIFSWGSNNFGIWILITAMPATISFLNINFAHAATQEMTINHEKGKFQKVNEIFQNNLLMLIFNILIYSMVFFLVYFFFDLEKFSALEKLPAEALNLIVIFVFLSFYLDIFNSFFICGISYLGKLFVPTYIRSLFDIIAKLSVIVAGIFYDSLIYAGLIFFIVAILKFFTFFYYFNKYKQNLEFSFKLVSGKIIKRLFTLSIAPTMGIFTLLIKHNVKILLIGLYFGPQIIAYITTCKTLFYFFPVRLFDCINLITYFEYAKLFTKRKFSGLRRLHNKHILLVLSLLIIFVLMSLGIGKSVYNLWLNNQFNLTYIFLIVVLLDAACAILFHSVINVLVAINHYLKISTIEFCFIIFSTIVSFYFLSLGYSFMVYFFIILIQSFIVLLIAMFIVFKFYKFLKN